MLRPLPAFLLAMLLWLGGAVPLSAQAMEELEHSTVEADRLLEESFNARNDIERYAVANQSLSIARSLRYDGGIVRASLLLGEICVRLKRTEEALQHYLEAEEKLGPVNPNTPLLLNKPALIAVYSGLGDLFFQEKLYDNARHYYDKVLRLVPQDYKTMEKAGDACLLNGQLDSAEIVYQAAIPFIQDQEDYPHLVQLYQKLATAFNQNGNPAHGLGYYLAIESIVGQYGQPFEKAVMYNNLGKQYAGLQDYKNALDYFRRAEIQCEYIQCDQLDVIYANLGVALHNTGDSKTGVEYLLKAQRILAEKKDRRAQASLEHLIASVYFSDRDIYNALSHNNEAIALAKETRQSDVLATAYRTGADIYYQLYDFENAYDFYKKYLNISDTFRLQEQARLQNLEQQRTLLTAAESRIRLFIAEQNFKDLDLQRANYEKETLKLMNDKLVLEAQRQEDAVRLLRAQQDADQAKLREQALQALQTRNQLLLTAQQLDAEKKERLIAGLRQQEQIDRAQRLADSTRVVQLRRDREFQQREQENFKKNAFRFGLLGLVILALMAAAWLIARRASRRLALKNRKIEAQKAQIEAERQKSDSLLLNILPDEIAQELKAQGYANPRYYEAATVLFTDFTDFTKLSAQLTPEQLIDELDECFLAFDEICEKHHLEKIKTIGDAYMCAGGLPIPNDTHALDAVRAALEMAGWLDRRNRENPAAVFRQMRIGVHTGPVIAGVIGKNKFAYDIWGDAVNLAARLEELGEPGRVNVSGATKDAIRAYYHCTYRGKKEVHNKGLVDMYFVAEEIPQNPTQAKTG